VLRKKGKPDPTHAKAEKRTAARFYQLKSGLVPEEHGQQTGQPLLAVRTGEHQWHSADEGPPVQALFQVDGPADRAVGDDQVGHQEGEAEVACQGPTGG